MSKSSNRDKCILANGKEGMDINAEINELHPDGDEYALLRKEIHHIEEVLNITPTEKFAKYYADAENAKTKVRARLYKKDGSENEV